MSIRALFLVLLALGAVSRAQDRPAMGRSDTRNAATSEALKLPLRHAWTHVSPCPPAPAWDDPARHDHWHHKHGLRPRINFDRAFEPVAAGGRLFYASSGDDGVHCLDGAIGKLLWSSFTEGPVRVAPTVVGDRVYVGSDDGRVFCLSAADGTLHWTYRPSGTDRRIIGNGRMISRWPIRTGVVVDKGAGICGAGLFPTSEGAFLCSFDAETGKERFIQRIDVPANGPLAASDSLLVLPTGRTGPAVFARKDGKKLNGVSSAGGDIALIAGDVIIAGSGDMDGRLDVSDAPTRQHLDSLTGVRMVVGGERAYVLSLTQLGALDWSRYLPLARRRAPLARRYKHLRRKKDAPSKAEAAVLKRQIDALTAEMARCWLWRKPCDAPDSLLLAGNALVAGGNGRVLAFDAKTGDQAWSGSVDGRAHSLAAADGKLFAGTSHGSIVCFTPGDGANPPVVRKERAPMPAAPGESVLGWWLFRPECLQGAQMRDMTKREPAAIVGVPSLEQVGSLDALAFDGSTHVAIARGAQSPALPSQAFSAEAWVRVDRPLQWGGIIGALQDNGSYEKGWILGFNGQHFAFAVKTPANKRLTYLKAATPFARGRWHHVAGAYDGKTMRIYVDGKLQGTATDQRGPIDYPPAFTFDIGAYHDKDEFFRLTGAIHEVVLHRRPLSEADVARRYEAKTGKFPARLFTSGPTVEVDTRGRALVRWKTDLTRPARVEYWQVPDGKVREAPAVAVLEEFRAVLTGLEPRRRHACRVVFEGAQASRTLTFLAPGNASAQASPYPRSEAHEKAAETILKRSGVTQGFCLLLIPDAGPLACEMARRSRLRILCVERDAKRRTEARALLARAGLYGTRVVLHDVDPAKLPYPARFANLVVANARSDEIARVLRPYGGAACIRAADGTWAVERRGPLEGAGEWTHGLGDPGNTACTMDRHVAGPLELQWFGAPGPHAMADRHHRNVAPLFKDGRLFIPGDDHLFAADAYNGTPLWKRHMPGSIRLGAFLDCSNMAVDEQALYFLVGDKCHVLDVATGRTVRTIAMPQLLPEPRAWGYVAKVGKVLVGTARKPTATYTEQSHAADDALWYDNMSLVTSDYAFAVDPATGEQLWTYRSGVLLNTTLTIGDERVYFVESHSPKALEGKLGRSPMRTFLGGPNHLTALKLKTGEVAWQKRAMLEDCQHIVYLNHAQGKLILSGNKYIEKKLWYFVYGLEADSGELVWQQSANSGYGPRGSHGEQNRHPTIVGDVVYAYPVAYNLHEGEPVGGWRFARQGHGCGNIAASAGSLFWRGGNPWRWDLGPGRKPARINSVTRPGCWINLIPAGGLLLAPEASSGCTCAFPLQTSMAYAPKQK